MNTSPPPLRRSFSQIIHQTLFPWEQMDWPLDWNPIFGRQSPIVVEIGFGNGAFLVEMAREDPSKNYLGIEPSWGSIRRLLRQLEASDGIDNIRIIKGHAKSIISSAFASDSIHELYINFPDPWRKTQHYFRRFIQQETIALLANRIRPNGRILIATDHAGYAVWIANLLEKQFILSSCYSSTSVNHLPGRNPTRYERKALDKGTPIRYFVWEKEAPSNSETVTNEVGPMPNAILQADKLIEQPIPDFEPRTWKESNQGETVIIKTMAVFQQLNESGHLVEVLVREGDFSQHFAILLRTRSDASILIKAATFGYPRPTWGVKRAINRVAQWVIEKNPGTRVLMSKVGQIESSVI